MYKLFKCLAHLRLALFFTALYSNDIQALQIKMLRLGVLLRVCVQKLSRNQGHPDEGWYPAQCWTCQLTNQGVTKPTHLADTEGWVRARDKKQQRGLLWTGRSNEEGEVETKWAEKDMERKRVGQWARPVAHKCASKCGISATSILEC